MIPHMDAVYHILRYLKSSPGKCLLYTKQENMQGECYIDADWAVPWTIGGQLLGIVPSLEVIYLHGEVKSKAL